MFQRNNKHLLFLLGPLAMVCALAMDIYLPAVPYMKDALHTNTEMVQWTLNIFLIGMGCGQCLIGPLSDNKGRRPMVYLSILGYLVSSSMCGLSTNVESLIIFRFFQGFFASGCLVICWAIVRDAIHPQKISKAYSIINGIISIAPILAPTFGVYLYKISKTWRSCFALVVLISFYNMFMFFFFFKETLAIEKRKKFTFHHWFKSQKEILCHFEFLCMTSAAILGMTCLFGFFSVSPILLVEKLHLPLNQFAICFGINATIFLIANLSSGHFQEKINNVTLIFASILIIMIGALFMLVLANFHLKLTFFMTPALCITVGVGMMMGPISAQALKPFGNQAGSASALLGSLQFMIAGLLGHLIVFKPINTAKPFAIAVLLLSFVVIIMFAFCYHKNRLTR